jgi:hypothetical protein
MFEAAFFVCTFLVDPCGPPKPGNIAAIKQEPTHVARQLFDNLADCEDAAVYLSGRLLHVYEKAHPPIQVVWHCKRLTES